MEKAKLVRTTALAALMVTVMQGQAFAQQVPGSADAGRIGGQSQQALPTAKAEAPLNVKGNAPFNAPQGAEKITFVLKKVSFDGMTSYAEADLRGLYADKIGQTVSLADIYSLAANVTAKYRNDGYILTQVVVPPQTIENGVVHLRVVEGSLDQIRLEGPGAQGSEADVMKLYVGELKAKGVLNNKNLERTLLLINDLPGVTARSVLSPSKTKTGMSDLTIVVERKSYDGNVELNNYGSRYLGRWQAQAGFGLNSPFGHNERIDGQFAYAPSGKGITHELIYGELRGSLPIGKYGTRLEANMGASNTEPGHTLDQFDVLGKSRFGGVSVFQPFIRSRELNLNATAGIDLRSTETKSNIDITREDKITALRLAGHMDFVDTLFSAAVTSTNIELSKGLSILGASDSNDTNLSRPDGDPTFTKLTADVSRLERLANSWALQTSIRGQMANAALLSAEEFGLGGATNIGRGYDPSELVGDDGVSGSLELQWTPSYQLASWLTSYTVYGFYDIGKVWNDDATSPSLEEQSLASVGLGFRTEIGNSTRAGIMLAKPLTRDVAAENDDTSRLFVNVSHDF